MAYSDSELLTQWQAARDRIVDAIVLGDPVVEYQIGSRRVRREATSSLLALVDEQIAKYTSSSNASARNLVRLKRNE